MKTKVFHTSSAGNFSTIPNGMKYIAIDLGGDISKCDYLSDINDVLLTHKHQDHANIKNIKSLIKLNRSVKFHVYNCELYSFLLENDIDSKYINFKTPLIGYWSIGSFELTHDAECNGFIIDNFIDDYTILYATDFGDMNDIPIINCDEAFIEGNYWLNNVDTESRVSITHNAIEHYLIIKSQLEILNPNLICTMMHLSSRNG